MTVKATGVDLSMTATGITWPDVDGGPHTEVIKPRTEGDQRLAEIAHRVTGQAYGSDLVLIEGFLNKSFSAGITGMVHGAVRAALIGDGLRYATISPMSLKKFATGRGNATKIDMAVAAFKRAGLEFKDDNACDSWWLWAAAMDHLGAPVVDLPKVQRDALTKIKLEYA